MQGTMEEMFQRLLVSCKYACIRVAAPEVSAGIELAMCMMELCRPNISSTGVLKRLLVSPGVRADFSYFSRYSSTGVCQLLSEHIDSCFSWVTSWLALNLAILVFKTSFEDGGQGWQRAGHVAAKQDWVLRFMWVALQVLVSLVVE